MSYIVVFEYDKTMSGTYGSRFIVDYHSKEAFDGREQKDDGTTALAAGISEDEAQDLLALTPEICVVFATLEEAYQGIHTPSPRRTEWAFDNAQMSIALHRERIQVRSLARPDVSEMIDYFYQTLMFDKSMLAPSKRILLAGASPFTGQILILA